MGCDIHCVLEMRFKDKWIGLNSDIGYTPTYLAGRRFYFFFIQLASVRGTSTWSEKPLPVPDDISDLSMYYIESFGTDGHNHGCVSLENFVRIYNSCAEHVTSVFDLFQIDIDEEKSIDDYRVVFFFDN